MLAGLMTSTMPSHAQGVGNSCKFEFRAASINFGTLIPGTPQDAVSPVFASGMLGDPVGDCAKGQPMLVQIAGSNSNMRQLKHASTNDVINYTLEGIPGRPRDQSIGTYVQFEFSGKILASDYANAPAGNYSDTVYITVTN